MSPETATAHSTAVLMPKIGQAMAEGVVVQWHKKDGEHVNQGETLVTIETDKATYDLEAQASGVLRIYVTEGHEVKVGTVIGEIGDGRRETTLAPSSVAPTPSMTIAPAAKTPPRGKKVLASPKAKQLAAEHGIDLATLLPSNADGIISASDVEHALATKTAVVSTTQTKTSLPGDRIRERRQLMGIRKTSAHRVQEAWQTIPHIVQMIDVDATALRAARAGLRAEIPTLTINDVLLHAAAQALAGLPEVNGVVEGDSLTLYNGVDIGFAVDTPRGLVAPVIRRAEAMSLAQLAAESQRLIEIARAGRLRPEDVGGASLTVSNLGMFGIRFGTPVINLAESILVFVGAVEDRPVAIDGQVAIRPMLTLSIAYDHRVADGVAASQFTRGLKERLENLASAQGSGGEGRGSETSLQSPVSSLQEKFGKRGIRSVSEGDSFTVQVRSQHHEWTLDEPQSDGGKNLGPDPVSAFLGALLSCMTISFKAAAKRRKVELQRITGHIQATPQGHVKEIALTLEVWSPAPEENVRALLEVAKRGCYVSGVLKPELEFTLDLVLHGS